jgi:prolyl 4-hydroxylase
MDLSNYVRVYSDVLSQEYCNELIDFFDSGTPIFRDSELRPKFYELGFENHMMEPLLQKLRPSFEAYIETTNSDLWFPQNFCWEFARVKMYRKGTDDQFAPHVDVGDRESSKRCLAFLIYLNDVAEGGETCFVTMGKKVVPKLGTMIMFPPLWTFPHQGKPTISNNKYILSTYINYV